MNIVVSDIDVSTHELIRLAFQFFPTHLQLCSDRFLLMLVHVCTTVQHNPAQLKREI